jgi:hypothetical protein
MCWLGGRDPGDEYCKHLWWNGACWRCRLIASEERAAKGLSAGEGCCATMNTYRILGRIPSPEELKDEAALLRAILVCN